MEEQPIKVLKGIQGASLELYSKKLLIKRKGFVAMTQHGLKGDKTIYYHQLTSIQVKPARKLQIGYIQFSLAGGIESVGGLGAAMKDENTVAFDFRCNKLVEEIRAYVEKAILSSQQPAAAPTSVADELGKLKNLFDDGVLTKEEFEAQKKKMLG
jgi:hypothetical protein